MKLPQLFTRRDRNHCCLKAGRLAIIISPAHVPQSPELTSFNILGHFRNFLICDLYITSHHELLSDLNNLVKSRSDSDSDYCNW